MKQHTGYLLPAALSLLVSACAGNPNFSYSPGDDPLVNAYFESYLYRNEVAYVRQRNGDYATLRISEQSKMVQLGEEARKIEPGRGTIEVDSPCVQEKLSKQLRSAGVIYAQVKEPGKTYLVMTKSDFDAQSVPSHFAEYVVQCEPWGDRDK